MILTRPLRIVSLIASSTEIVCALGLQKNLVGKSHECDYPPGIESLPVCTGPKFGVDGTSYEIDQKVKAILQESLSVYRVDAGLLEQLQPTHIITQSQCEVCAVSLRDVMDAACEVITSQPQIVSLEPNCLTDIWTDIRKVGEVLGVKESAERLIADSRKRLQQIKNVSSGLSARPRVAFVEWIDPLMTGGNWMPELVEIAGGINLFGTVGTHSPPLSWSTLQCADPDVIVVAPCGFDVRRTLEDMKFLCQRPGWNELKAVRDRRVYVADGNQYFNRPGPRMVESAEILAEIFHPQVFNFKHQDAGWIPFTGNAPLSETRA